MMRRAVKKLKISHSTLFFLATLRHRCFTLCWFMLFFRGWWWWYTGKWRAQQTVKLELETLSLCECWICKRAANMENFIVAASRQRHRRRISATVSSSVGHIASYFMRHNMSNEHVHFRKNKLFIHSRYAFFSPTTSWSTKAAQHHPAAAASLPPVLAAPVLLISCRSHTQLNVDVNCCVQWAKTKLFVLFEECDFHIWSTWSIVMDNAIWILRRVWVCACADVVTMAKHVNSSTKTWNWMKLLLLNNNPTHDF